jgi:DNA repair photolyase
MGSRIRYERVQAKAILNKVKTPAMPFEWSINPYRGCSHGCSFCYARSTHSFLGMESDDTFQNHILLKENAPEALKRQLDKMAVSRSGFQHTGSIAIGTATDPYQAVEAEARLTRSCLEVLAKYPVPVSITTRSPLVLRDLDLLKRVRLTSVNISLNTLDVSVWRRMEPASPSPAKRMDMLRQLGEEGVPAGIFMAPILPFLTDGRDSYTELIETAARNHAKFVMPSYLRLSTREVKVWFFRTLETYYPELVGKYAELYRDSGNAPAWYREPVEKDIRALLAAAGLPAAESYNTRMKRRAEEQAAPSGPEQLAFNF